MRHKTFTSHHGFLVSKALGHSWRRAPSLCDLSEDELVEIVPILVKSGTAGLVCRQLQTAGKSIIPAELLSAYKQQTLQAAVHEDEVVQVFRVLARESIDALLVKGWAIARLYPEPGLRRYSDIDLCVGSDYFARAKALLQSEETSDIWIDLHKGTGTLDYDGEKQLMDRSVTVPLRDASVRVPAEEDHLRILCFHLLRHGGGRPLWLCDVALALESRSANFDWNVFFGDDPNRAHWLVCVLGLAHKLLDAKISDTPVASRIEELPEWLMRSILRRWGRWYNSDYRDTARWSFAAHKTEPKRLLEDMYFRCDPIRATVEVGGAFDSKPRLPYQIAAVVRRGIKALSSNRIQDSEFRSQKK